MKKSHLYIGLNVQLNRFKKENKKLKKIQNL